MERPKKAFVWRCVVCNRLQTTNGVYDEKKEYKCPSCKTKARIFRKALQYQIKRDPFTFECPYCEKVQRVWDYEYKGNVNGYYVTEADCPDCGKHMAFKQADPFHILGFMFKCPCGHITKVHRQYFPDKPYRCEHCHNMIVPSKENVMEALYE